MSDSTAADIADLVERIKSAGALDSAVIAAEISAAVDSLEPPPAEALTAAAVALKEARRVSEEWTSISEQLRHSHELMLTNISLPDLTGSEFVAMLKEATSLAAQIEMRSEDIAAVAANLERLRSTDVFDALQGYQRQLDQITSDLKQVLELKDQGGQGKQPER
ncbi:MAG: hypothetical protein A3G21_01970 [Acidobacteria bacterium RIFCSPLOWO2_12_FULL_66_21]|nr:MAG: hypothetical protein A3G21_01970 [Acidobacteria bacterium RIFCSPLOWO2_12_FULL_66_21]